LNLLGLLAGFHQGRQKDADQKRDDPDHHQEFDEREPPETGSVRSVAHAIFPSAKEMAASFSANDCSI
jgi:hypothetical protein